MQDGAEPPTSSLILRQHQLNTAPLTLIPSLGHLLSPLSTPSALSVSMPPVFQAASDLRCFFVPDSPIVQEHSAAGTTSVWSSALPGLIADLYQLSISSSAPVKNQSGQPQLASLSVLKDLLAQLLSSVLTVVQSKSMG